MMACDRKFDVLRKMLSALLMLSILLLSFHSHGSHGHAGVMSSLTQTIDTTADDHASPSHDALPESSGEVCVFCTLMGQLALPTFEHARATFVVRRIAPKWAAERGAPPAVGTRLYRPPIARAA